MAKRRQALPRRQQTDRSHTQTARERPSRRITEAGSLYGDEFWKPPSDAELLSYDASLPFVKHRVLHQLQPFQVHPVAADLGKIVLGLLHKPAVFGTAENLR